MHVYILCNVYISMYMCTYCLSLSCRRRSVVVKVHSVATHCPLTRRGCVVNVLYMCVCVHVSLLSLLLLLCCVMMMLGDHDDDDAGSRDVVVYVMCMYDFRAPGHKMPQCGLEMRVISSSSLPFSPNIILSCLVGVSTGCVHVSGYFSVCPTTFISWWGMCRFAHTNTTYTHHSETYCTYTCRWIPFSQEIMLCCLVGMYTRCTHVSGDLTMVYLSVCPTTFISWWGMCRFAH